MGEGRWVEVRVVGSELDGEEVEKAVRQLRKELAEQEFMTQSTTSDAPESAKGDGAAAGLAVALVGVGGMVPALIAVLKDWICRRHSPGTVKLTLGDDSIELDKPTFKEREQLLEAFLTNR
jgi:hypothetical protein